MSAPHTPGPWVWDEHGGTWYVFGPNSAMVADSNEELPLARVRGVGRGATSDEQRANARLIAAAPRLLAALCELDRFEQSGSPLDAAAGNAAWIEARHAIAQALGDYR